MADGKCSRHLHRRRSPRRPRTRDSCDQHSLNSWIPRNKGNIASSQYHYSKFRSPHRSHHHHYQCSPIRRKSAVSGGRSHHPYCSPVKRNNIRIAISEDIIASEILPRLPVRSLLRFKSVCKSWHALISGANFITSHLARARESSEFLIALSSRRQQVTNLYTYEEGGGNSKTRFMFGKESVGEEILDYPMHSNGLVLLNIENRLVLCNPGTRESKTLPECSQDTLCSKNRAGFGFVTSANVFKVAQYYYRSRNIEAGTYSLGFEVFTVGVDSCWRATDEEPPYAIHTSDHVSIGETVYFKIDTRIHKSSPYNILAFGLKDEKFSPIPRPHCFSMPAKNWIIDLEGVLRLVHCPQPNRLEIWTYEDHINHVWTQSFSIDLYLSAPKAFYPVTIRHGKLLLFMMGDGIERLEYYDPKNKSFNKLVDIAQDLVYDRSPQRPLTRIKNQDCTFQVISYVESLVPIGN